MARPLEVPVLLLGSAKEAEVCETIANAVNAQTPGKCQNLAGKTALGVWAAETRVVTNNAN